MESYIEISWLHNILFLVLSQMMAGYLSLRPLSLKKQWGYALLITSYGTLFWTSNAWIGCLLLELICILLWYRHTLKTYFFMLSFRMLWNISAMLWVKGTMAHGLFFPAIETSLLKLWILGIFLLLLLQKKWHTYVMQTNFVYSCKLIKKDRVWKGRGYMDSGNMLMYDGMPVVFMDWKYQSYFSRENIQYIEMQTMNETGEMEGIEVELLLENQTKQNVFVCFKKHLYLPLHCDLLFGMETLNKGG